MRADESSRGFLRPPVEQTDVREEDDHGEAEEPVDRARRCRREREESDVDRERDDEEHDPENRQPVEGVRPTALAVHRVLVLSCEPYIDPNHITVPARYPPRYCVSPETHTLSESETAFVGAFATDVGTRLAERLADARPAIDWETEYPPRPRRSTSVAVGQTDSSSNWSGVGPTQRTTRPSCSVTPSGSRPTPTASSCSRSSPDTTTS